MAELSAKLAPGPLARAPGLAGRYSTALSRLRFGAGSEAGAEVARGAVLSALDRLEAELDGAEYLVGDSFSVADLTAASLFYPLVLPPEAPRYLDDPPEGFERFRAPLKERAGYRWVGEMFRRHRGGLPAGRRPA